MSPLHSLIAVYLRCVVDARHSLARPAVVVPFVLFSLIELVALLVFVWFASPPFVWFAPVVIRAMFGEAVLHYPDHVLAVPGVLDWIRAGVGVAVGFVLLDRGGVLVMERLRGAPERSSNAVSFLVCFFMVNALFTLALAGVDFALERLAEVRYAARLGAAWWVARALARPFTTMVIGFAWCSLRSRGDVATAIGAGAHAAREHFGTAALVSLTVAIFAMPPEYVLTKAALYVVDARPGLVMVAAAAAVLWDAPLRFLAFSSALSLRGERGGGASS